MICHVEALRYRCLKHVEVDLGGFHVLVGPNASGKSTFLNVVSALSFVATNEVAHGSDYTNLFWLNKGDSFELAVELKIPDRIKGNYENCRYEVAIGKVPGIGEFGILSENVWLKPAIDQTYKQTLFPLGPPSTLNTPDNHRGWQCTISKLTSGNDYFYPETKIGYKMSFRFGPQKSALRNLPEDEDQFPVTTWLKNYLKMEEGIQDLTLNSLAMRNPCPPGMPRQFLPDGSNLPWVIATLKEKHKDRFDAWLEHLRTALPDLADIDTITRPEDMHKYLFLVYDNGLKAPSWMVSDGTLRMLALTILAYLPDFTGTILVEEPENGIHPRAIDTVMQSLSSVYDAQVLLATHSPVVLGAARLEDVLCFSKAEDGSTNIVHGKDHPNLKNWKGEPPLETLYASGVLS